MRRLSERLELSAVPFATHRAVVRAGVLGAWVCTIVFVVAWLVSGESRWLSEGIGPLITAIVFTGQVVFKRENAVLSLLTGAAVVIIAFSMVGTADTSVAAIISLWVFAVAATFFVVLRPIVLVFWMAIGLAVVPNLWAELVTSPVAVGLVLSLSFVITAILILSIRSASARSETRYRRLFTTAPVALLEQEWSDAIEYLESLGAVSEADVLAAIADMDVLAEVMSRVRILRMNAKARSVMGIEPDQHLATLPRSRVHAGSAPAMRQQVIALWQGKPRFEVEYVTHPETDPDTDIWVRVEVVSTEILDHSHRIVISVTDITQLKQAQNTLEELVRSKDEFIASISHELRTPLTGVMGLSAALLDGRAADDEERDALLEVVVRQSEEVSYLVEDLLVGARADIGTIAIRPEELDLRTQAEAVFAGMESPVEVEVRSEILSWADPLRVRQIIRNLAVNAGRYGGDRQKAIIYERDGQAVFDMYDSGDPIPEEARERIFQPYGRAHHAAGTTASVGLGLAVSRQLAGLMGGSLEYVYDGGSVFRLTLPGATERGVIEAVGDETKAPARH
ncbi:MAG: HAMP domain-containing histidine kinase [Acidimicrobiia bacterium]|nr:HAMP domain-containing histidine kinase [Acidimicrobiia bacterium]